MFSESKFRQIMAKIINNGETVVVKLDMDVNKSI